MRCTHLQDESWYDTMKGGSFVSDFGVSGCERGEILRCFRHQIPVQSHDDSSCWFSTDVDVHEHLLGDFWIALDRVRIFCHRIRRQGERRGHQRCGQRAPPVPSLRAVSIGDVSRCVWTRSAPRDVFPGFPLSRAHPSLLPRRISRGRKRFHVRKTRVMRHPRRRGPSLRPPPSRHNCAFPLHPIPLHNPFPNPILPVTTPFTTDSQSLSSFHNPFPNLFLRFTTSFTTCFFVSQRVNNGFTTGSQPIHNVFSTSVASIAWRDFRLRFACVACCARGRRRRKAEVRCDHGDARRRTWMRRKTMSPERDGQGRYQDDGQAQHRHADARNDHERRTRKKSRADELSQMRRDAGRLRRMRTLRRRRRRNERWKTVHLQKMRMEEPSGRKETNATETPTTRCVAS